MFPSLKKWAVSRLPRRSPGRNLWLRAARGTRGVVLPFVIVAVLGLTFVLLAVMQHGPAAQEQQRRLARRFDYEVAFHSVIAYLINAISERWCVDPDSLWIMPVTNETSSTGCPLDPAAWVANSSEFVNFGRLVLGVPQGSHPSEGVAVAAGRSPNDMSIYLGFGSGWSTTLNLDAIQQYNTVLSDMVRILRQEDLVDDFVVSVRRELRPELPTADGDVYLRLRVEAIPRNPIHNLLSRGQNLFAEAIVGFHPNELNNYFIIANRMRFNLRNNDALPGGSQYSADVKFPLIEPAELIGNSSGFLFGSPIYVDEDIVIPSDVKAAVHFDQIVLGTGKLYKGPTGATTTNLTVVGEEAAPQWNQRFLAQALKDQLLGIDRGYKVRGRPDQGFRVWADLSTGSSVNLDDAIFCSAYGQSLVSNAPTAGTQNIIKKNGEPTGGGGEYDYSYLLGLTGANRIKPQLNITTSLSMTDAAKSYLEQDLCYVDSKKNPSDPPERPVVLVEVDFGGNKKVTAKLAADDRLKIVLEALDTSAQEAALNAAIAKRDAAEVKRDWVVDNKGDIRDELRDAVVALGIAELKLKNEQDDLEDTKKNPNNTVGDTTARDAARVALLDKIAERGPVPPPPPFPTDVSKATEFWNKQTAVMNAIDALQAAQTALDNDPGTNYEDDTEDDRDAARAARDTAKTEAVGEMGDYKQAIDYMVAYDAAVEDVKTAQAAWDAVAPYHGVRPELEIVTEPFTIAGNVQPSILKVTVASKHEDAMLYLGNAPTIKFKLYDLGTDGNGNFTRDAATALAAADIVMDFGEAAGPPRRLVPDPLIGSSWTAIPSPGGAGSVQTVNSPPSETVDISQRIAGCGNTNTNYVASWQEHPQYAKDAWHFAPANPSNPTLIAGTVVDIRGSSGAGPHVKSTVDVVNIHSDRSIVVGFISANTINILARTSPLIMIGTYMAKRWNVDPSVGRHGFFGYTIHHPMAIEKMREVGVLGTGTPNSCDALVQQNSPSFVPVWHPEKGLAAMMLEIACSASVLRNLSDPHTWTRVTPPCHRPDGVHMRCFRQVFEINPAILQAWDNIQM